MSPVSHHRDIQYSTGGKQNKPRKIRSKIPSIPVRQGKFLFFLHAVASNHTQELMRLKPTVVPPSFLFTVTNYHLCFNNHAMVRCVYVFA